MALNSNYTCPLFFRSFRPGLPLVIEMIPLPGRGELCLIPAGAYDEGYIHRLADLNIHALYHREVGPR
jgi:hypothetical protein